MRILFFSFPWFLIFSEPLFAEVHRDLGVLPQRSYNDLQVVRENGQLFRKELLRDGIQTTLIESQTKPLSQTSSFSDFVGKKSCRDFSESEVIVSFTEKSDNKAKQSCEDILEGKVLSVDTLNHSLICRYACKKVTLEAFQSLFFENFVKYIEPNAPRELN